jgi:hypothetical protein
MSRESANSPVTIEQASLENDEIGDVRWTDVRRQSPDETYDEQFV